MKKKKLLRAMELADEKFVAEADPEKQLVMNMQLNKNAKRNEDIYK